MKKIYIFWTAIAILSVFLSSLAVDYDFDFFARLIVGEQFIEHGVLHFKDFLSYTPSHIWYDHEWGSSVIFYFVLKHFGPLGIVLLHSLCLFLITYFVVKIQRLGKHNYPLSIVFISIFLVLLARQNPTLIRCQDFSFVLFTIFLYILEKNRVKSTKLIWLLPPMIIVWNNLHGGVMAGIGLIIMYLIGAVLEKKSFKNYIYILFSSLIVLIINPYGLEYVKFVFSAATMNRKYITEWWPFFAYRHILYYLPMSLYGIFGFVVYLTTFIRNKNIDYTKIIVITMSLIQGLWHVKLLSLSLIVTSAFCYNEISQLFISLKQKRRIIEKSIYLSIFILGLAIPLYSPQIPKIDKKKFPIAEVEFVKINDIKGNILVPFGFGSYVSYKLYPDNLIYMDGRYEEVYNNEEFLMLRDFSNGADNWEDILKKYPTDIVFAKKESIPYNNLYEHKDWELIFHGMLCGVFVKKTSAKDNYINPSKKLKHYKDTAFDGYFGNKLRKDKK